MDGYDVFTSCEAKIEGVKSTKQACTPVAGMDTTNGTIINPQVDSPAPCQLKCNDGYTLNNNRCAKLEDNEEVRCGLNPTFTGT